MGTIYKIEDFEAWVKARELNSVIHKTVAAEVFNSVPDLKYQLKKSSRSVMANLAEGFSRRSNKAFLNFISISLGSLNELKSDIYVCTDLNLIPKNRIDEIMGLIEMVDKLCNGMTRYLIFKIKKDYKK